MIKVINFRYDKSDIPKDQIINVTSRSDDFGKAFSPFLLGPVRLYDKCFSYSVENAWQYSKVYPEHVDENNEIKKEYFDWANFGWLSKYSNRYPMGKGAKPLFAYWNGERLSYTEAKKKIYIPLYTTAVSKIPELKRLFEMYQQLKSENKILYLVDFDAYNLEPGSFKFNELINEDRSFGHGYVVNLILENMEN